MKRRSRILSVALSVMLLAFAFAGCANSAANQSLSSTPESNATAEGASQTAEDTSSGDYDFFMFNTKGENADALDATVAAYAQQTGIKIKTFSLGSGTSSEEALRADMSSNNKPAIFSSMNPQALQEWVDGDFAMELTSAELLPEFKALVDDLDPTLRLTMNGSDSYGIPYNVEGYGYIVDTAMLDDLFGAENTPEVISAFKTATYAEFEGMVTTVDAYIKDGTAGAVTLSGKSFALAAEKTGKAQTLEAVFSVAGSEKWTYGDHFVNIAVDAVFPDVAAAVNATNEQVESLQGPLIAYAKALDLKTSHAISARGPEFVNATTNNYDAAVANFANGKALFMKQGNWCYTNYEKANPDIIETLTFLPIKMPFTQEDIKAAGQTLEHMNASIPVFAPNYYILNKQVSEQELVEAQKFLVWLNTTPEGQKFVMEDMAFIPYNADPATTTLGNSLSDSIISYVNEGKTITNAYAGAPFGWSGDTFGLKVMEEYLTKGEWTESDYEAIADYAIATWIEMK